MAINDDIEEVNFSPPKCSENANTEPQPLDHLFPETEVLADAVINTVNEALLLLDSSLCVELANRSFYVKFQTIPTHTLGRPMYELGNGQWNIPDLRHLLGNILQESSSFENYIIAHDFLNIGHKVMRLNARKLRRRTDDQDLILLTIEDVTKEHQLNEQNQRYIESLQQTEKSLRETVEEKILLLQELHHRVKNNLQVITSLLSLQANEVRGQQARAALEVAQTRVRSIAAVHELLYNSDSLNPIDLPTYVQHLSNNLRNSYGVNDRIQSHVEGQEIAINLTQAVLVGLLLNELISNAYKHAFPGKRKGTITIRLTKRQDNRIVILVIDTGIGIPKNPELKRRGALGLELVKMMATQLKGTVTFHAGKGTTVEVCFPLLAG